MNDRYHLWGDKLGGQEFHLFSDDREKLINKAHDYINKGYFVFLQDQKTGSMKEIRI